MYYKYKYTYELNYAKYQETTTEELNFKWQNKVVPTYIDLVTYQHNKYN